MRRRYIASLTLALCLGLASLGALAQEVQGRQPLDRIVAVVNEGAIMASDLNDRLAQVRTQLEARGMQVPPDEVLRQQVLERLVDEEIQLQMAEQANLSVDDTELNAQVRAIAETNGMTLDQFADALEADGLTLAVVREQLRRDLLIRQVQQRRVGSRVSISDAELDRFIEQQGGNITRDQARQALFQRKANDELEVWINEIRSGAFIDERLDANS